MYIDLICDTVLYYLLLLRTYFVFAKMNRIPQWYSGIKRCEEDVKKKKILVV